MDDSLLQPQRPPPLSYSLQGLQHDDAVSPDDHHADGVLLSSGAHLQTVIHHQVHEGVEPSQDALYVSASVQLQGKLLVHELLQLRWMCFAHFGCIF